MACLERSVCRSLKLVSSPAKPILAKGPAGPRFPIKFKLINGESRIAKRNASKPEILKREGNVMFVSFSQQKETKEVPNSSVLQPTP
ncbi:MAG: hypothetical protein GY852_05840, partial [bacterium]|nr:hypothetical protein [bacterium]